MGFFIGIDCSYFQIMGIYTIRLKDGTSSSYISLLTKILLAKKNRKTKAVPINHTFNVSIPPVFFLFCNLKSHYMNKSVLRLFGKAIPTENQLSFQDLNARSLKVGFIVHPSLCNLEVSEWINEQSIDYSTTFYKIWGDVISKNRFELYIDQLKHYASTYGTDYKGDVWLPDGNALIPNVTNVKVITTITKGEALKRCDDMLFSGIALKPETIADIFAIYKYFQWSVDLDKVKNKEAKMMIYKESNIVPENETDFVRFLIYLATGKTLLIKDRQTIEALKSVNLDLSLLVSKIGYTKLSSVFFRFKPLFLAMKGTTENNTVVNKLRKLANKNHKPLSVGYFENLLNDKSLYAQLPERLKSVGNFKKIALLQTINVRLKNLSTRAFLVRNQKLFIKEDSLNIDKGYLETLYAVIYADLKQSLSLKACSVAIPKNINLTLPISEKSFIGNYPLGTSFDFSDFDNIVGINWKGIDGAHDLDLSLCDVDGNKYGWNANYKNDSNSIVYSGDITNASPEATELMYASNGFKPAIVKVNLYNGNIGAKLKFFIAKEHFTTIPRNYMIDPNNVLMSVEMEMDSKEKSLGVITGDKFILAQFRTGKGYVSTGGSVTDKYIEYALSTLDCYLSLEQLLKDSGFTITDRNPAIDLRELSKDTLISLIS